MPELVLLSLLSGCPKAVDPLPPTVTLPTLQEHQRISGFRTELVWTNGRGPVGARFLHERTGFVLDLITIESVPQAYVHVGTIPDSDRGEPHTQEHLLLGKGNVGRATSALHAMSLVESSAFTAQLHTAYHLHTSGGPDTFLSVLEADLGALLKPDYTDEEIRREVHHFGPGVDADGAIRLEERGTVYNEMVTSSETKWGQLWRAVEIATWGPSHPRSFNAGGEPDAIRTMTPEHIRAFHRDHYALGNMGAIVALPPSLSLASSLAAMDGMLVRLQPDPTPSDARWPRVEDLPAAAPVPSGTVGFIDYPSTETGDTAEVLFVWAPGRQLDPTDETALQLVLSTLAGDASSDLYQKLVASDTRLLDTGATRVSAWVSADAGHPVYAHVGGVSRSAAGESQVRALREVVTQQLAEVSAWTDGDPALAAFERRLRAGLTSFERRHRKAVATPPEFGIRGTGSFWYDQLQDLARRGAGFQRDLTYSDVFASLRADLDAGGNPWGRRLVDAGLVGVLPAALVSRPSPDRMAGLDAARNERVALQTAALVASGPDGLVAFRADYEAKTAELDRIASAVVTPPFLSDPPLELDPFLTARLEHQAVSGVPIVYAPFSGMAGAEVGLALRLDRLPPERWPDLSVAGALFGESGVVEGDVVLSHAEVVERVKTETLGVSVYVDLNTDVGVPELVFVGSGSSVDEARAATKWMRSFLLAADWREENLPRLRDLLDEELSSLRRSTHGAEEGWVDDPARAWRWRADPLRFSNASFLTRTRHVMRLRWRLMAGSPDERAAAALVIAAFAPADRTSASRDIAALRARGGLLARAADDLEVALTEVPDGTLATDLRVVASGISSDLRSDPAAVLAGWQAVRSAVLRAEGARMWVVADAATASSLEPDLAALTSALTVGPLPPASTGKAAPAASIADPYVGLVVPRLQGGVVTYSTPSPMMLSTDRESLLTVLAGATWAGHGPHGLFMKTWGAGLAYSNGARPDVRVGRMRYYAERCPEIPQTLAFVASVMRDATVDDRIAEYSLASSFHTRSAQSYESRGASIARDLAQGLAPEVVRLFRTQLLALRDDPNLVRELAARVPVVYGDVLPGLGRPGAEVEGAVFLSIGPESQQAALETWLTDVEGRPTTVRRLYARDFWWEP